MTSWSFIVSHVIWAKRALFSLTVLRSILLSIRPLSLLRPRLCTHFLSHYTSRSLLVSLSSLSLSISASPSVSISLSHSLSLVLSLHLTIFDLTISLPPLLSSSLCLTLYPQLVYPSLALSHRCACSHILLIFLFFICSSQSWWYCSNISHELTSLSPSEQKIFAHIQRHPQLPLTWHRKYPESWEIQRSSKSHDQPR